MKAHAFRLHPGQDLKKEIEIFVSLEQIKAGYIATCVGSLSEINVRLANQTEGTKRSGHFEIISLVGTVSMHGCHLHISLADETGAGIGGHLLIENQIYTTAEIVLIELEDLVFTRENDHATGWRELVIRPN